MTMENWQDILFVSLRSEANALVTSLYLISWIFLGNYVLLNLFLAILIDGFTSKPEKDEDDIFAGEEDLELKDVRLKKKRKQIEQKEKKKEEYIRR